MQQKRQLVDSSIISTQAQLIPPSFDYVDHNMAYYASAQSLANWSTGSVFDIVIPSDPTCMMSLYESRILIDFYVQILDSQNNEFAFANPCTFTPTENMLDSFFSNITLKYGSTSFQGFWVVSDNLSNYVSGIYRLLFTKDSIGGMAIPPQYVKNGTAYARGTTYSPMFDQVNCPFHLSVPLDNCNPHITSVGYCAIVGNTEDPDGAVVALSECYNTVYRHANFWAQHSGWGTPTNNRFSIFYKPYTPEFNCSKAKLPLLQQLTLSLRRNSPNLSYIGEVATDVYVPQGGTRPVGDVRYNFVFTKLEFWLSKYRLADESARLVKEILLSGAVAYPINKVVAYSYPVTLTDNNLQYTVNQGLLGSLVIVSFLRSQAIGTGLGAATCASNGTSFVQNNNYPGGSRHCANLCSAPFTFSECYPGTSQGITALLAQDYFFPSVYVNTISILKGGKMIPQIPYNINEQFPLPPANPPAISESYSTNLTLGAYDRAYEVFKNEVRGSGCGDLLKHVTRQAWMSYLRLYAFNLTDDNTNHNNDGNILTDKQSIIINATFNPVPPLTVVPAGTNPAVVLPTKNNTFQMIVISITNQAVYKLSETGMMTCYV